MCTLVCRWDPDDAYPVQLLALRDERRRRAFDPPGTWWPATPELIGGRDREAGGSWCVSAVASGTTAVVLNRPERRLAQAGAPSRGIVPLLAAAHGSAWTEQIRLTGMASFNLVLAQPHQLSWWSFDGDGLTYAALAPGVHVFKPAGRLTAGVDPRLLAGRAQLHDLRAPTAQAWGGWFALLGEAAPTKDGTGLLVERTIDTGDVYETVFGQFIAAAAGTLRIDYQTHPASRGEWTTQLHRC